ncbi:hypothetical protein B2J88_45315 [Rhodococcus sp. SRB_17]|nr:hypothetical protein [Rhodococcus sp. SRB_17]
MSLAVALVKEILEGIHLLPASRVGLVWLSSSSGSSAYMQVLERLGNPRKRTVATAGPVSGANGIAALVGTEMGLTGPMVSIFGEWSDNVGWLATHYLRSGRADVVVVGSSQVDRDEVVVGGTILVGDGQDVR